MHHPHPFAVLVPEEGDGSLGLRLGPGQLFGHDLHVAQDLSVDEVFDLVHLGPGHRGVVGEVEAQAVGGHQGSLLLHVGAQDLP